MAVKQAISTVTVSQSQQGPSVAYYATFTGTSFTAQLEANLGGDWIPMVAPISASMTTGAIIGKPTGDMAVVAWRWNVTAINAGTLTVYLG